MLLYVYISSSFKGLHIDLNRNMFVTVVESILMFLTQRQAILSHWIIITNSIQLHMYTVQTIFCTQLSWNNSMLTLTTDSNEFRLNIEINSKCVTNPSLCPCPSEAGCRPPPSSGSEPSSSPGSETPSGPGGESHLQCCRCMYYVCVKFICIYSYYLRILIHIYSPWC